MITITLMTIFVWCSAERDLHVYFGHNKYNCYC